eukprot:TRINITY_DN97887_c0_g1_i1.p1 TRINITY_DN97887_c0_g1~~TRINITY_DN97887_c0_g1_i1.p1  ORF type:complete len:217 (+),score=48.20 TRINITY_DN97887_c0_g1_i1:50-652(+)
MAESSMGVLSWPAGGYSTWHALEEQCESRPVKVAKHNDYAGASAVDAGAFHYVIKVDRSTGAGLGLDINYADGQTLLVKAVDSDGLLASWNASQLPTGRIGPGHRIVAVNGVRGNSALLMEQCRKRQLLELAVQQPPEAFFEGCTLQYYDCGDELAQGPSDAAEAFAVAPQVCPEVRGSDSNKTSSFSYFRRGRGCNCGY